MVAYTITPAADDTFTVKDFGVYDLYTKTGDKHKADTERLAQQIESKLTLGTLSKNSSRRHFEIFFLIFPRKQVLIFHANCLHWR